MLAAKPLAVTAGGLSVLLVLIAVALLLHDRDILHPAVVVALFVAVLTAGRSAYVLGEGAYGMSLDASIPLAGSERAFSAGILAQLLTAGLFAAGALLAGRRRSPVRRTRQEVPVNSTVLGFGVLIATALSLGTIVALVGEAGGVGRYLTELGNKQHLFEDRGWLYVLPALMSGATLAWFAAKAPTLSTGNRRSLALGIVLIAGLAALGTGSRSAAILLLVLPLVTLLHYRVGRIPIWLAAVLAVLLFTGASGFREVIRDRDNPAAERVYTEGLQGFLTNTFASPDARLPDAPAVLREESPELKYGSTFASALVSPVPRSVWESKPEGANAEFSRLVAPARFRETQSEFALTLSGELLWNFSWPGLCLMLLLGYGVGVLHRRCATDPGGALPAFLYAAALSLVVFALRADSFNTALAAGKVFAPGLLLLGASIHLAVGDRTVRGRSRIDQGIGEVGG